MASSFDNILCPVDFSENSELALDYTLCLAAQHGAHVCVLHVLPDLSADPDVYPYLSDPVLPGGETRERALEQLGGFVHRALAREIAVEVTVEQGDTVDKVVAKSSTVDLVVLGTHGRRRLSRLLMGSVTERVLRHATPPVLSVSPHASAPPSDGVTFRNILCPVDFSASSMRAYELALSLAGDDGTVTLLHAVEFYIDKALGEAVAFDMEGVRQRHNERAREKLEEVVGRDSRSQTKLETANLESGAPYKEILRVAERDETDAIVMGVMGRSAADLFFFGSTANHVVRSARCPVLTVRAEE